jgi:hypothetical protein
MYAQNEKLNSTEIKCLVHNHPVCLGKPTSQFILLVQHLASLLIQDDIFKIISLLLCSATF